MKVNCALRSGLLGGVLGAALVLCLLGVWELLADDIIPKASLGPALPQVQGGICTSSSRALFSLRAVHLSDGLSGRFLIFLFPHPEQSTLPLILVEQNAVFREKGEMASVID